VNPSTRAPHNHLQYGLSGCRLHLLSPSLIRKQAQDNYKQRLAQQCRKQQQFERVTYNHIAIPRILDTGTDFFDMEYIPSSSFQQYFHRAGRRDVLFIFDALQEFIDSLIQKQKPYPQAETLIREKLAAIEKNTQYTDFVHALQQQDYDFSSVPQSPCHGDLTLSNMLFLDKKIYFIDFLDSFLNSFLIDLAKLKQDLCYFWSAHIQGSRSLRVYQIKRFLWSKIQARYEQYLSTDVYALIDAMNILRIEPYLKEPRQKAILRTILTQTPAYEYIAHTYGWKVS